MGSSGAVPLSVVAVVLVGSVGIAMAVLAAPWARLAWPLPAAIVLLAALGIPWLSGWPVLALAAAAIIATPLLIRAGAIQGAGGSGSAAQWSPWRYATTAAAGWVTMFVLLLLYPLHYEITLPIDNRWLPGIAVVLACLPLLRHGPTARIGPKPEYTFASPSGLHRTSVLLVGGGAVLLGAMVHVGMVGGSPLPGPDETLSVSDGPSEELSVATYNTGQGQDAANGRLAFREVAEVIVGLDSDVVALQEVARGWPLTAMSDFDAWLRAHTDLRIEYAPAADRQFGNALVSRVPLREVVSVDLGQQGGAQRRSAIRATLSDGTTVYAMHLQARNSEAAEQSRLDQMELILDDWQGRPTTVLAGDMNPRNEYVDSSETPPKVISNLEAFLDAGFVTSQPTQVCTLPTSNDNCSDYVFHSPDLPATSPHRVQPTDVSDHRPVEAVFRSAEVSGNDDGAP